MDPIRTLLLARTHLVILDPDRVAEAATRPTRDSDVEKFEDELAQLGFVMSLDLALTIRRFPHQAIAELRAWIVGTLAKTLGAHRPHVPLFRAFPVGTPGDTSSLYLRRILCWLLTRPEQPCPWCGQVKMVGALDACGHLVCRTCWDGGNYAGCPICHRRVAIGDPFIKPPPQPGPLNERVLSHDGELRLLHLGFDLVGSAQARFELLLGRATPLSPDDRIEIETVIDSLGPKAAMWLPKRIPVKETMAVALARLWIVSPDRSAMVRATMDHLRTATDVLRVAMVLMGGNAELALPIKLASISRGLRRAVLEALDRLPMEALVEDMQRHPGLWKRAGERLHPYEHAQRLPTAALAFAVVRGTSVDKATFGATLRAQASQLGSVRIENDRVRVTAWAGVIEDGLRSGNVKAVAERLAHRPGELLRRADHLVRVTQARQPEALPVVLAAIGKAATRGAPAMLLTLAGHVAKRGALWPRRVFFPKGEVLRAWGMPDTRIPLTAEAIGSIVETVRAELVARAATKRHYPRAVLDRGLVDLLVPIGERSASKAKIAWPRGSEVPIAGDDALRLFLHWEEPGGTRVDLDLSVALYDAAWRHVGTCDFTNLVVGAARAAIHSGDLTSAPAPLGASEFVDLQLDALRALGARHAVMVVFSYNAVSFDQLTHGFAGLMVRPPEGTHFDPRSVAQRFDLRGRSVITVPLTIDLEARSLRWLDVHVQGHDRMHQVGGYRAALAHIGRDYADLAATGARPTLWDVACIHAAARANLVYVRERDGSITSYRRRDGETAVARLARLVSGSSDDGKLAAIPPANAPTWFAVLHDDLAIPKGSAGYVLDARSLDPDGFLRLAAGDLIAELAAKP
jgi:hypothetical protein